MIKIIVVLALVCLSQQNLFPAAKSNVQTKILAQTPDDPYTHSVRLAQQRPESFGIDAFGAKWIEPLDFANLQASYEVKYQVIFDYDCPTAASLHIATSTGKFKATVNNDLPMTGDDPNYKYIFPLAGLKCQRNILQVTTTIFHGVWPSLIFAIVFQTEQCQHNCKTFATIGYVYRAPTCQCVCSAAPSACPSNYGPKKWADYPICGCTCKNIAACGEGRQFNWDRCTCKCKPISCGAGMVQDPYSCKCKSTSICQNQPVDCPGLKDYNWDYCQCMCREMENCFHPFIADQNCGCYCPTSNILCNNIDYSLGIDEKLQKFVG